MREASRIGANIIQADWIQFLPNTSPDEEGMGMGSHFASVGGSLYGLWINTKTGKRFTDEFGDRKTTTDAIFKVLDAGGKTISVTGLCRRCLFQQSASRRHGHLKKERCG